MKMTSRILQRNKWCAGLSRIWTRIAINGWKMACWLVRGNLISLHKSWTQILDDLNTFEQHLVQYPISSRNDNSFVCFGDILFLFQDAQFTFHRFALVSWRYSPAPISTSPLWTKKEGVLTWLWSGTAAVYEQKATLPRPMEIPIHLFNTV